ncbi:glycosyltransferase family 2 protein [Nocardioides gilvus]|uniref:glycosyltransferase family 2 protein n=1 Tax=Nocardioides gilvus TaxID=1735589 RepID=UPI000D749E0A|nr:glycosyltransferase [Nocardioides gilvus]
MTVLIGIPTYRRPEALRRLLRSLVVAVPAGAAEVCLVDNDPEESARAVAEEFRDQLTLTYLTERRPGVVHVRNRLVAQAMEHDALVFVDDDQWVTPGWFTALMEVSRTYPEAVVAGPVPYVVADSAPEQIRTGGFFERPQHENLSLRPVTATGNSLIPRAVLAQFGPEPFDPAFAQIGGEDTDFFQRVTAAGTEIRWAASALAHEEIPLERATMSEAVKRYRRAGYVLATIASKSQPRPRLVAGGVARVLMGAVKYARRRITRRPLRGQDVAKLHGGLGYLAAALGRPLRVYGGGEL